MTNQKKKIEPLDFRINIPSENKYKEAMAKYVAEYTEYEPGGFLSVGRWVNKPDIGQAQWNKEYPRGYVNWQVKASDVITGVGVNRLIDKINEIIDELNTR